MKLSQHTEFLRAYGKQVRLSKLWKEKVQVRRNSALIHKGQTPVLATEAYKVSYDDPAYPKGERVVTRSFVNRDQAYEYAKHIARTVDLRREGVDDHALGVRTGYIPKPEPSSVVPIAIQTPFGMQELAEVDVFPELYDPNYLAKQAGNYTAPPKDKVRGL